TKHWSGKIPLVLGMPIMMNQNSNVEGGIINGSRGILKQIHYELNTHGEHVLTSCIVVLDSGSGECIIYLPLDHVPVLRNSVDITIVH
ncbi:hypothetical protein CERSUDRAFT_37566, partial [Gelatoporia subvermispora B]